MKKHVFVVLALFVLVSIRAQIPTAGLIAYYPMCGNANDFSGNSLNGTVNGAVLTSDRFGKPNSAYNFNGVNNYISLPPASFVGLNVYSYSLWMKPTSNATSGFIAYSVGSSTDPYCLSVNYNSPTVFAGSYNVGSNPLQSYIFSPANNAFFNNWIHVVVTRNATTLTMYVNSVLVQQQATANTNNQPANYGSAPYRALLGARSSLANFFPGGIDELRVYTSVLTQNDVNALYNEAPFSIAVSSGTICSGNSFVLTPSGASSYTYSGGTATVSPLATSIYTVTSINSLGCMASAMATVQVANCTAIKQQQGNEEDLSIFPNPGNGSFIIKLNNLNGQACQFVIKDLQGRIINTCSQTAVDGEMKINVMLAEGCYTGELFVDQQLVSRKKIIVAQ
ncbi:MAG: LamG-like jellyroll fold domain-containing protein [Bacteroidota bacterium]